MLSTLLLLAACARGFLIPFLRVVVAPSSIDRAAPKKSQSRQNAAVSTNRFGPLGPTRVQIPPPPLLPRSRWSCGFSACSSSYRTTCRSPCRRQRRFPRKSSLDENGHLRGASPATLRRTLASLKVPLDDDLGKADAADLRARAPSTMACRRRIPLRRAHGSRR